MGSTGAHPRARCSLATRHPALRRDRAFADPVDPLSSIEQTPIPQFSSCSRPGLQRKRLKEKRPGFRSLAFNLDSMLKQAGIPPPRKHPTRGVSQAKEPPFPYPSPPFHNKCEAPSSRPHSPPEPRTMRLKRSSSVATRLSIPYSSKPSSLAKPVAAA